MILLFLTLIIPLWAEAVDLPLRTAGETAVNLTTASPASAISNLYNFVLGIGAMAAFGIIVYAAFRYTTTESASARSEAQGKIYQALLGLLLLLGSTVILQFISPNLPNLSDPEIKQLEDIGSITTISDRDQEEPPYWSFQICPLLVCEASSYNHTVTRNGHYSSESECASEASDINGGTSPRNWLCSQITPAPTPGTVPPVDGDQIPGGITKCSEAPGCIQAVQNLDAAGIRVRSTQSCYDWERGCTSFVGSAVPAIVQYLKSMQVACMTYNSACRLTVTGATEPGHQSHAPDKAIVDLAADPIVSNYIYTRIGRTSPTPYRWYKDKGADIYYYWETSPVHWHICFSNVYCTQAGG